MSDVDVDGLRERGQAVRAAVEAACARCGRSPDEVTIIAVSKLHPAAAVDAAYAAGFTAVGENYVQEWVQKRAEVQAPVAWHFIGSLQRNKAKYLAGEVALVHAVDSLALATELGRRAAGRGATQAALLAVNLGAEATKSGLAEAEVEAVLAGCDAIAGLQIQGLMTMPPPATGGPADQRNRAYFARLRALRDRLGGAGRLPHLSMGMSDDFEAAIAEGATLVRIGTAIFGARG